MSLLRFLHGARPNPREPDWQLQHRHAEGGPWRTVCRAASREGILEEVLAGAREWGTPGDLAQVLHAPSEVERLYGIDQALVLRSLPVPLWKGNGQSLVTGAGTDLPTWPEAWARCPRADWMANAALPVLGGARVAQALRPAILEASVRLAADDVVSRSLQEAFEAWTEACATGEGTAIAQARTVLVDRRRAHEERPGDAPAIERVGGAERFRVEAAAADARDALYYASLLARGSTLDDTYVAGDALQSAAAAVVARADAREPSGPLAPRHRELARWADDLRRALPLSEIVLALVTRRAR